MSNDNPLSVLLHQQAVDYIPANDIDHEGLLYADGRVLTIAKGPGGYAILTVKEPTPMSILAAKGAMASNGHKTPK